MADIQDITMKREGSGYYLAVTPPDIMTTTMKFDFRVQVSK